MTAATRPPIRRQPRMRHTEQAPEHPSEPPVTPADRPKVTHPVTLLSPQKTPCSSAIHEPNARPGDIR